MYTTRVFGHVNAPRSAVYQAFLDADAIAKWRVPVGMTSRVHQFEAREGGSFPGADNETGTRIALAKLVKLVGAR